VPLVLPAEEIGRAGFLLADAGTSPERRGRVRRGKQPAGRRLGVAVGGAAASTFGSAFGSLTRVGTRVSVRIGRDHARGVSGMQIEERVVDDVTILDLKGKMTLGEGDELLKDKIASLVSQGKKKILLNLEAVPYIDSAGLGEIVRTYTSISRQGGRLKLLNVSKRIQDLLVITKLITIFDSYDGEAEAVKSFAA
jgi:anti-sigma B factor antagonist